MKSAYHFIKDPNVWLWFERLTAEELRAVSEALYLAILHGRNVTPGDRTGQILHP